MIKKILKENKNLVKKPKLTLMILNFLFITLFGLPMIIPLVFFLAFWQRAYPHVFVCQISLSGKTQKQAENTLTQVLKENSPSEIILTSDLESFTLDQTMVQYLPKETGRKSLKTGREKFLFLNLPRLIKLFRQDEYLSWELQINDSLLEDKIASVAAKLYRPAIDPEIKISKSNGRKTLVVETGKNGREIDLRTLKKDLLSHLACPQKEIILKIPLKTISPQISAAVAEAARQAAENLLNKEISLVLADRQWTVNDEEMISFISFGSGFKQNMIKDFGSELAKTINAPPENASFRFEDNRVLVFKPAKDGLTLKENEFSENLEKKLIVLQQTGENQLMEIPVLRTPAKISTGDANSLGIRELLAEGSSFFYGSIPERIHNVNLASLRLSGILVAPGEEFSFNQALGDVSENTGFKQAYIIKEGRTVLGDGGGVCQVSTTLFRAALNAGLPIVERHAHAYRVHYYEDDLGPGFDATVFDPTADLKFKNDTGSYILIQANINLKKKQLIFDLYGAKDGRRVEISKARVWDKQPPPPDFYQDDPTLPLGTIKQVDWKAWGAKVVFDYKVTRGEETLEDKTFTSYYHPWQAVFLRGTGG